MPRRSKGPRLELQTGEGRTPKWIIRDGAKNISTRCDERDREQAEARLAEYILAKHDPAKAIRSGSPNEVKQQKVLRHTLRHTAITWYLDQGVDIEKVSLYCGVSVATIRKTYRHVMPGTFDDLLNAAHHIGR